jgi:hypothetical protein
LSNHISCHLLCQCLQENGRSDAPEDVATKQQKPEPDPSLVSSQVPAKEATTGADDSDCELWDDDNKIVTAKRKRSRLEEVDDSDSESISSFDSDSDSEDGGNTEGQRMQPLAKMQSATDSQTHDVHYCRQLQLLSDVSMFKAFISSLCFEHGPFLQYSIGGHKTLDKYSAILVLDVVPMVARMVQSEMIHDSSKALGICSGADLRSDSGSSRRVTRGNTKTSTRFRLLTPSTQLGVEQLENFLVYGFVGTRSVFEKRIVLPLDPVSWMN